MNKRRVLEDIRRLALHQLPLASLKKLKGFHPPLWQIDSGDFRIFHGFESRRDENPKGELEGEIVPLKATWFPGRKGRRGSPAYVGTTDRRENTFSLLWSEAARPNDTWEQGLLWLRGILRKSEQQKRLRTLR